MPLNSQEESDPVAKSLHHDWHAFLIFINRTTFPVDVIWCDYQGRHVRYKTRLMPGARYSQNTYVSHPWKAWNSDTFENVKVGGGFVFNPQPWRGERHRTVVFIDRPMLPLLEIALRKVRKLVKTEDIEKLEIPQDLFHHLKQKRRVAVTEYINIRRP